MHKVSLRQSIAKRSANCDCARGLASDRRGALRWQSQCCDGALQCTHSHCSIEWWPPEIVLAITETRHCRRHDSVSGQIAAVHFRCRTVGSRLNCRDWVSILCRSFGVGSESAHHQWAAFWSPRKRSWYLSRVQGDVGSIRDGKHGDRHSQEDRPLLLGSWTAIRVVHQTSNRCFDLSREYASESDRTLGSSAYLGLDYFLQVFWQRRHQARTKLLPFHHPFSSDGILLEGSPTYLALWIAFISA